jgi:hypothetical protein
MPRKTSTKAEVSLVRSSAAEYLTFVAASGQGGVEAVYAGLLRSERELLANPPFNDSDPALRACAFPESEAKMQVVSESKDNMAGLKAVRKDLPNGPVQAGSYNHSGDCNARSASSKPKPKTQRLPRQRNRRQQTLFIDARKLGTLACKTRPRRRTLKTNGVFRVQKPCISSQTRSLSRLGR